METNDFFPEETGAGTGAARENARDLPGFTEETDRLFRSHFQHVNRLDDRVYEDVRPAYMLGYAAGTSATSAAQTFDEVERDLEHGWLNVRVEHNEWQAVREFAREAYEHGRRIGFVAGPEPLGGEGSHKRASFNDPVPDGIDPTSPESPEQTLE